MRAWAIIPAMPLVPALLIALQPLKAVLWFIGCLGAGVAESNLDDSGLDDSNLDESNLDDFDFDDSNLDESGRVRGAGRPRDLAWPRIPPKTALIQKRKATPLGRGRRPR